MAEDLHSLYANLPLADNKIMISTDSISQEVFQGGLTLVGKLLAPRTINFESISLLFRRLWNPKHGVNCKPLADNIVFFQFCDQVDKATVLAGCPWLFNKYLLDLVKASDSSIYS